MMFRDKLNLDPKNLIGGRKSMDGEIDETEYAKRIVCDAAESGIRSGVTTFGALALASRSRN